MAERPLNQVLKIGPFGFRSSGFGIRILMSGPMMLLALFGISRSAPSAPAQPNVLIILADDMGFSDAGCYGGEIATPNLDALAKGGLRFTQFYNTARCWPTRSSLMTGYYAQQVRMDPPKGLLPKFARVVPHYLKPLGYRCYHSGKWHVQGAPKPVADGGFDRSYWSEDWDRYFTPAKHFEDDQPLPKVGPEAGYYATTGMADQAIRFLKEHAEKYPGKPFFQYLAFFSPHFPLMAPAEDIAKYRDKYQVGWDVIREQRWERLKQLGIVNCDLAPRDPALSPRYFRTNVLEALGPGEVRYPVAWSELTDEQKKFQAAKMSIHAAMVDRMDREIGRVLEQVRAMGAWENTIVFFLSDNGADATIMVRGDGHDRNAPMGSRETFLCVGPGWAGACNAPFRRYKVWVSEGGTSTPLIVHWPNGIKAHGELRHDLGHVSDFVPTLLELAGGKPAATWNGAEVPPLPGQSLVPAFARDHVLKRTEIYFSHEGNRSLRQGHWKLVSAREDNDAWELFDLATDRCEKINLATQQPEQLQKLQLRWTQLDEQYRRDGQRP